MKSGLHACGKMVGVLTGMTATLFHLQCKHQLATRLAVCLGKERTTIVADPVLAEVLQE